MISNKLLERVFQFFAAVLTGTAVFFYLSGNYERVFVAAVLGSLCFFIGIRFQVKERLAIRNKDRKAEERALEQEREPLAAGDHLENKAFEADDLE
ncbi:MAG: hypothetical protein OEM82_14785 [Acidobacteriota bacterium]|nr:hypothetical protein [Acidobacteriota bacterium]MDH3529409.1 hypothetical protein [Acidobacteriota bacterium]